MSKISIDSIIEAALNATGKACVSKKLTEFQAQSILNRHKELSSGKDRKDLERAYRSASRF